MADRQRLEQALMAADAAGDARSATLIANEIRGLEPPKNLTAGEVVTGAVTNFPKSMGNLASGLYSAVTSPLQTGKAVLDAAAGGLQNILPESLVAAIGEDKASREVANKVGQEYVRRYGGIENAKRTIANDPAGFMADVSTVLTGSGAGLTSVGRLAPVSQAGSTVGRVGSVVGRAGAAADPLTLAIRAAAKPITGIVAPVLKTTLGLTTGAGAESVGQAYRSGRAGGQSGYDFKQNMRGEVPVSDVLDNAKQNLSEMNAAKQSEYRSGMVDIKNDKTILDFTGIDNALVNAKNRTVFKNKVVNQKAADDVSQVNRIVVDWKLENPADYHTPEGIDALKRKVGDVLDSIPYEQKNARAAVQNVYNSIKSEITKQAPSYARVMRDYSESTDQIREIERALSLGQKASADTGVRKLQSLMRNNVNTNYWQRTQLAKELIEGGGRDLMPALAGQALNNLAPRGLQGVAAIPTGFGAFSLGGLPLAGASLLASSPRVVGESAFAAGATARGIDMIPKSLLDPRLYNLLYQSGNIQKNQD